MPDERSSQERWDALLRITRSWRLEWGVDRLLTRLAKEAVDLLDLDRGLVLLLGSSGLTVRALWPEATEEELRKVFFSEKTAQRVVESGRSIFSQRPADPEGGSRGERGIFCVPLTASRGVLGALYVETKPDAQKLTYKDQEFLEMLGMHAAVALEHALFHHAAVTDSLTGLYSHRHFQVQVEQEIRRAIRAAQPVSLILLDLDNFKSINDKHGHEVGNQVLIRIAEVLKENLRSTDTLGRFGGDEFEILLPGVDVSIAREIAEKIRAAVAGAKLSEGARMTSSFGVASYPENALNAKALFLRADSALYQAKDDGRDCTRLSPAKEEPLPPPEAMRGRRPIGEDVSQVSELRAASERLGLQETPEDLDSPTQGQVDGHPVVRRLGIGTTSEVLLVIQPDLGREVALKKLLKTHSRPEQIEAFEKEARLTASLEHPGVITVHSIGRDLDGGRYYTMKPIHGLSLDAILKGRRSGDSDLLGKFTLNRLVEVLQRVCEAVAYAHERGVAHLDLNPTNVIVGGFGEVTVIDWSQGLSSLLGRPRMEGRQQKIASDRDTQPIMIGTPTYAAPEQLPGSGEEEGPASDMHALGAILYEILTDRPPYTRDTIEGTIEALRRGILTPPEVASPRSGIDPSLSDLCMRALSAKPSERPDAVEFAEVLGRFARSEAHWEVIRFGSGPDEHPVREDEWTSVFGMWRLEGASWVPADRTDSILVWNIPLHGAHRFICEGWVEKEGELALITHGPSPEMRDGSYYEVIDEGYCFEFGAEFNTCTKLTRRGHDVMAKPGVTLEPGRRYRIEVSYQDGWLHCFVDGRRVFEYRELFPLTGRHVGFYGYGVGSHIRPLELHREAWGLKAPVMRMADDLLGRRYYDAALRQYSDIAEHIPHRLEGDEARLKKAICLVSLGKLDEARRSLRELKGSQLEPFALAEEAMIGFRGLPRRGDPGAGVKLFTQLHHRFPKSQAKARILEVVRDIRWREYLKDGNSLTRDLEIRGEISKLGSMTFEPPVLSQIFCARILAGTLMSLGRWREALEELLSFRDELLPEQHMVHGMIITLAEAALANGRDDLLPRFTARSLFWSQSAPHRCLDTPVHAAVRVDPEGAVSFYEEVKEQLETGGEVSVDFCKRYLLWCLVRKDLEEAKWAVDRGAGVQDFRLGTDPNHYTVRNLCYALVESRQEALFQTWMDRMAKEADAETVSLHRQMVHVLEHTCRARWALEGGDADGAAEVLEGVSPPSRGVPFTDGLLIQVMLSSLGKLSSPGADELGKASEMLLAGTSLDLARMFHGERDPVPNEMWPHRHFHPEYRLWLALWLEAKGEKDAARGIAEEARDPRYGLAQCQPAIEALLERLDG